MLHIYFGNNGLFWLPFLRKRQIPAFVSFHGADVQVNVDSPIAKRLFQDLFASCALVLARSESLASALVSAWMFAGKASNSAHRNPPGDFSLFCSCSDPQTERGDSFRPAAWLRRKGSN